ncbi:hypothetical protein SLNWT_4450 [Streptomyces albus]|uniref:Uncharacterized protein n=1 Tax=Streptomyces albus (strain ATCC 21838 / DSM 41398 / FERM P-419 / JCM 4703 / NBRC 107858) TaxID=1081613 RepID=A0A0B5F1W3_STRA4|nr:hypothetical protein SLNWT_4450 [Streptomyces albus]AOU79132.1 hypothetical protein SLNHY_4441 [Streptomyces albus]AYN34868.1 hypothetical protein DUI70_4369 [Streptomyces albus]
MILCDECSSADAQLRGTEPGRGRGGRRRPGAPDPLDGHDVEEPREKDLDPARRRS